MLAQPADDDHDGSETLQYKGSGDCMSHRVTDAAAAEPAAAAARSAVPFGEAGSEADLGSAD